MSGILMGLYIPCLIAWLNHTLYMFGAVLPYEFFAYIMEPITLLSWFLIALGMRRMDPPDHGQDPPGLDLDGEVSEVFGEAVGTMRRMV